MANNPYVNKVQYGNTVLIDLTGDTATAADVVSGKTFHDATGASKIGSYIQPESEDNHDSTKSLSVLNSISSELSTYPDAYGFYNGGIVVYQSEIHILGGPKNKHYKWNWSVSSWSTASTMPSVFNNKNILGGAVVYNGEIHVLNGTYHYAWNGSSWRSVSTIPYDFNYQGAAVVYDGEIHIIGGNQFTPKHMKWDGSSWSTPGSVSLINTAYTCSAVVYNEEIHLLYGTYHRKWNGYGWSSVGSLPYEFNTNGSAVVYNGAIHIIGGTPNGGNTTKHRIINAASASKSITSNGTYVLWGGRQETAINKLITNINAGGSGVITVDVPQPSGNISLGTYTSNGSKSANVSGYATCSFTVSVSSSAGTPTWGKSTSGSPGVSVNTSGYTINCTSFYPMAIKISEGPSSSGYPYEGIIVRSSNTEGSTGTGLLYKTGSNNTCATMSTYQSYTKFYSNKVVVGTSSSSRKLKSYTIYGFTVS